MNFTKKQKNIQVFMVVGCVLLSFAIGCKEKSSQVEKSNENNVPDVAQVNEMGANVFQVNCATCHGSLGEGNGPAAVGFNPRNFKKDTFKNGANIAGIKKTLYEGISGTQMVAWKGVLSEEQIDSVAEYVFSLVPKKENKK